MINDVIGERYHVLEKVGQGGAAQVYTAMDTRLGRVVAIKVLYDDLTDDPRFIERFEVEAKAAARLSHPNVVSVYDYDASDGHPFIAMEYVPGLNLKQYLAEHAPLPEQEARRLISQVLKGLGTAHEAGLVHRDMKPHNVLLVPNGQPKIADFGIAKAMGEVGMTQEGIAFGTPHYLSPEQAMGIAVTPRSDLYAVGVMLYEMLSGRLPFEDERPMQVAYAHLFAEPAPLREAAPGVSPSMVAVVERAMAKDPERRFQGADEMLQALAEPDPAAGNSVAAAAGAASAAGPFVVTGAAPEPVRAPRRTRMYTAGAPKHRRYPGAVWWLPLVLLSLLSGCLLLRPGLGSLLNTDAVSSTPGSEGLPVAGSAATAPPAGTIVAIATAPETSGATPAPASTGPAGSYAVSATTLPPPPPSELVSVPAGDRGVTISWRDTRNETSYIVERSADGGDWRVVRELGTDKTSYTDTDLQPGTSYSYRVSSSNEHGNSGYSLVVSTTPSPRRAQGPSDLREMATPPPGELMAIAVSSDAIRLEWEPVRYAGYYTVQRSSEGREWNTLDRLDGGRTTYTDRGLRAGTTYYYRVRVTYTDGGSGYLRAGPRVTKENATDTVAPEPTDTPSATATRTAKAEATTRPSPVATDTPEDKPVPTKTPSPTPTDTPEPQDDPKPTNTPALEPTNTPSPEPTDTPAPEPTDSPQPEPTNPPSPDPTDTPAPEPTETREPEPESTSTPETEPEPTDAAVAEPDPTDTAVPADEEVDANPTDTPEPDDDPGPTDTPEPKDDSGQDGRNGGGYGGDGDGPGEQEGNSGEADRSGEDEGEGGGHPTD